MTPGMEDNEDARARMVSGLWSREIYRCQTDYEYLSNTYLTIQSKKSIATQKFAWNPVQQVLWEKMRAQKRKTGKIRQIWGKPRKVGATTLVRGMSFWLTGFHQNRKSLLVTHDEPSSIEVFVAQDLTFYRHLPKELKPPSNYESRTRLSFSHLNSEVSVGHARDANVGVTQTYDFLHVTEMSRFRNAANVMNDALFPTLSEASAYEDNDWGCSVAVLESTSRYGGTWFKEFAEAAMRGENEYEFTFIPAYLHKDYQRPVPEGFTLTVAERALMALHKLPVTHIVWRREEQPKYAKNPSMFRQNYPLTWQESWVLPTGTTRVMSDTMLEAMERGLAPGKRMMVDERGLHPSVGGAIEVWQRPVDGVYYDMGVDIASGQGSDGDKTAIEVIRRDTLEQVAECITSTDPASKEFEERIYWLGMVYNTAQIVPDVTGGWGWALLSALTRLDYPAIWQQRNHMDARDAMSQKMGFHYTKQSKTQLINNMMLTVTQHRPLIHSSYLYQEMVAFLEVDQGEWRAASGSTDDAMNAYMLALIGSADEHDGRPVIEAAPVTRLHTTKANSFSLAQAIEDNNEVPDARGQAWI